MRLDEIWELLENVRYSGEDRITARCPAHHDQVNSLGVRANGDRLLVYCQAGCATSDVMHALGLSMSDLFYDNDNSPYSQEPEAVYPYHDENGTLLYEVVRFPGKRIRPRKPDGSYGIEGVRRVLYRLPALIELRDPFVWVLSPTVYIVEGEKDVETLKTRGCIATTPPFGAGKWRASYVKYFLGLRVVIVADRDAARSDGSSPGLDHAREIAESLEGIAESVRVVQSKAGKDVSDHLEAGYGLEELEDV
jgi:putative DNA primase/helicase